jgi:hypothetical protein
MFGISFISVPVSFCQMIVGMNICISTEFEKHFINQYVTAEILSVEPNSITSGSKQERQPKDALQSPELLRFNPKNAPIKVLHGLRRYHDELKTEPLASDLNRLYGRRMRWRRGIPENSNACRLRNDFRQYLQLLGDEISEKHRKAGDVAPWPGETRHVPDADGIGMGSEHDWDRPGRLPCGLNHGRDFRGLWY